MLCRISFFWSIRWYLLVLGLSTLPGMKYHTVSNRYLLKSEPAKKGGKKDEKQDHL